VDISHQKTSHETFLTFFCRAELTEKKRNLDWQTDISDQKISHQPLLPLLPYYLYITFPAPRRGNIFPGKAADIVGKT